jgi:hypothetical protein
MTTHTTRALFVCGSPNQTTHLHRIAAELAEVEACFSPYYGDLAVDLMRRSGLIEGTIGGNKLRGRCLEYLEAHSLPVDLEGRRGGYDLVVTCSDEIVPKNRRRAPIVAVQEGILDPDSWGWELVGVVNLPWLNRVDVAWLARAVAPFSHVFCLDNHFVTGGQGALLPATLTASDAPPPARLHLIGVEGVPACGVNAEVLRHHRLDAASLASRVRQKFPPVAESADLRLASRA